MKSGKSGSGNGLRLVATFEALKGILVLAAGCGVLTLAHRNLHQAAVQLVKVLHFNPAQHYPNIFIDAADRVTDLQLWMLALSALLYAVIRIAEAYGLWTQQQWAEWFAVLSGAIYLPVELYEVSRELAWPRVTVLVVNLGIVAYLASVLSRSKRARKSSRK